MAGSRRSVFSLSCTNSYYDRFTARFAEQALPTAVAEAGDDESSPTPRPLDPYRYSEDRDTDQSSTCARMAVDFYNRNHGRGGKMVLLGAEDSHCFDTDEKKAAGLVYFHVNFTAVFPGKGGRRRCSAAGDPTSVLCFAEVMGSRDPETVTICFPFNSKEETMTRNNCMYCTGLSHPEQGGFFGYQEPLLLSEDDDEDDDSEAATSSDDEE